MSLRKLYKYSWNAHHAEGMHLLGVAGILKMTVSRGISEGFEELAHLDKRPKNTFRLSFPGVSLQSLLMVLGEMICTGPMGESVRYAFVNGSGRFHGLQLGAQHLESLCVSFDRDGKHACHDTSTVDVARHIQAVPWEPEKHQMVVIVKLHQSSWHSESGSVCVCVCVFSCVCVCVCVFPGVYVRPSWVRACELVCMCWAVFNWLTRSTLAAQLIITFPRLMLIEQRLEGESTMLWDSRDPRKQGCHKRATFDEFDEGRTRDELHVLSIRAAAAERQTPRKKAKQ